MRLVRRDGLEPPMFTTWVSDLQSDALAAMRPTHIKWWNVGELNSILMDRHLQCLRYHLSIYLGGYPDATITSHKVVPRDGVAPPESMTTDLQSAPLLLTVYLGI